MALSVKGVRLGYRRILASDSLTKQYLRREFNAKLHSQSRKQKATSAATVEDLKIYTPQEKFEAQSAAASESVDPCFEKLDLKFENAKEAFKSKTNSELLRALLVFNLCSVKPLVTYNKELMKLSRRLMGRRLFEKFMKASFYGQFVAGEDEELIKPTIARNKHFGVKSILDYSVEKDISREEATKAEMEACVSDAQPTDVGDFETIIDEKFRAHEEFGDRRDQVISARTYFYEDETACDENMQNFLKGIDAVSGATNATGFAAIKLTALGRPQLLLQLSEVLSRIRQVYSELALAGGNSTIKRKDFERYLKSFDIKREERKRWYTILDITQDGEIDLLDWHNLLEVNMSLAKLLRVPNLKSGQLDPLMPALTDEEEEQMKNMLHRVDTVVRYGKDKDVRVMVDAEQTYFQVAINRLTMEMMRKYNKDKAIVFNTYQCYLKEAYNTITTDFALSEREDFFFGAKLVRGAYMDQERTRAESLGYEDPINPSFEATTEMYEKVLTEVMERIQGRPKGKIAVMVASHNEDTVRFTIEKMNEYNVKAADRLICFGQLLGMCDQVSFSLGQAGYSVYKYVPYGPVEEVIPYLSRRAIENRGLLTKVKKEKRMLRSELWARLKSGQVVYRPPIPVETQ